MSGSASHAPSSIPADIPAVLLPLADDLELVGAKFREILADASSESQDMVRHAARFNGKRLRPALTCLAARLAGSGVTSDVASVAAIVELIHTATLVHDDILDGADVRRKVATLNTRWGSHAAVLVGDVLFSKAYRAAAWLDDPFASRYLSDVVGEVLEGEIHQANASRDADVTEDEYREIIRGKTAALYEAALVAGAHYGGATDAQKKSLGRFGHHLGMAFQIIDDRLDVSGDEATVGKSLGTDLSEGKMTLPLIRWLASHEGEAREAALAQIRHAWSCDEGAQDLAQILCDSGALDQTDEAARTEIERAIACLAELPESHERSMLETLAQFVVQRVN
ncbi:MAG: polyprenyl synthetase family protein [Planctomycetota bacterium]|nr:polyprenyl synthetase family protein [Planctomycetota bacterium]